MENIINYYLSSAELNKVVETFCIWFNSSEAYQMTQGITTIST